MSRDGLHIYLVVAAHTNKLKRLKQFPIKSAACLQETWPPWRVLKQKECEERRICKQPAQQR